MTATLGTNALLCRILEAIRCLEIEGGGSGGGTPGDVNVTVNAPVIVTPPVQPCIEIDGVVNPDAFVTFIDGVPTYYTLTGGPVPEGSTVTVIDPCDDRCVVCCDSPGASNGGLSNSNTDCTCDCVDTDLSAAAQAIGGLS